VLPEPTTQQIILEAALREFHQNGFKGARTSHIAQSAGISRTMLHYYFNTKEALFEAVLTKTFGAVLPHVQRMMGQHMDIFSLIENLVEVTADLLEENPGLPSFLVNILNESPQLLLNLTVFQEDNMPGLLDAALQRARQLGRVRAEVRGEDLALHIWALCSTPYLLAPYISVRENRDEAAMQAFLRQRRKAVLELIINGIKTKNDD
jgi:AcrR family transcriptional regulator